MIWGGTIDAVSKSGISGDAGAGIGGGSGAGVDKILIDGGTIEAKGWRAVGCRKVSVDPIDNIELGEHISVSGTKFEKRYEALRSLHAFIFAE